MTAEARPVTRIGLDVVAAAERPPKATGRLSAYDPVIADEICTLMSEGNSLNTICKMAEMPPLSCVYRWLATSSVFQENYARANEQRATARFESIDTVLEDMRSGVIDAHQARVQIDAIKWMAGKECARKYGDRVGVDVTGQININVVNERLAALQAGRLRARTIEVAAERAAIAGPQQETSTAASASLAETLCADDSNA